MYFSIYDDWSHDRFNEKENLKSHGWVQESFAVSGIKFPRPNADGTIPIKVLSAHQREPDPITVRNHLFTQAVTPQMACPKWMYAFHSVKNASTVQERKSAVTAIQRASKNTFFPFPKVCGSMGSDFRAQPFCQVEPGRCRHNFDCNSIDARRVGTCNETGWCVCRFVVAFNLVLETSNMI